MAYYPDLSPYNYAHHSKKELNIGWLEKDQPFPIGEVPENFFINLDFYLNSDFTLFHYMGDHDCEFCENCNDSSSCEIRVISKDGKIYAAPELIKHYIKVHKYLPPQEFIDAVMTGPNPDSIEYNEIIRRLPESWEQRKPDINDDDYESKMTNLMIDNLSKEVDGQILKDILDKTPDFKKFVEAYNTIMPSVYSVDIIKHKKK